MYARGILFGKMKYELGDHSYVRCPENGLMADIEFKTKGYFSGTYNAIGGVIKNEKTGQALYELSGLWNGEMFIKDTMTGHKESLFNATSARHTAPLSRPMDEQGERESQRLWHPTVLALNARDHDKATEEKSKIEDRQRAEAAKRADDGLEWRPRLFRRVRGGSGGSEEGEEDLDWILNTPIDGKSPSDQVKQILSIAPILPGQKSDIKFEIPPHAASRHNSTTSMPPSASNITASPTAVTGSLIDFDEPSAVQNAHLTQQSVPTGMPPRSNSQGAGGLLDDSTGDMKAVNQQLGSMNLLEPMKPSNSGGTPLQKTKTNESEAEQFFDAES
ncbi:MAG: hypothetical protein Q9227_000333 [Pyrenula ochraceoflavens]